MNIPQLTALCLRYQGVLLDASEEVVHVAVVDAPSHELLDALHFATTKRIEIDLRSRRVALRVKDDPAACTLSRHIVVSDGRGSAGGLAVIAGTQRCAIGNRNGFTCQLQTIDR